MGSLLDAPVPLVDLIAQAQDLAAAPWKRTRRRFTFEEDCYIRQEFLTHTPIKEIAAKLNRSPGTVGQRIFHHHSDLKGLRYGPLTRLVCKYGKEVLVPNVGAKEAVKIILERKIHAYAAAKTAARNAVQAERFRVLEEMRTSIAAGGSRNKAIFTARAHGVPLRAIAAEFGITRERVRQICGRVAFQLAMQSSTVFRALNVET